MWSAPRPTIVPVCCAIRFCTFKALEEEKDINDSIWKMMLMHLPNRIRELGIVYNPTRTVKSLGGIHHRDTVGTTEAEQPRHLHGFAKLRFPER